MSGLLVKSHGHHEGEPPGAQPRGLADRWPVLLGGAALTRAYVEQDLAELYDGEVRYARDAFEGLRLMDAVMAVKRGEARSPTLPQRCAGRAGSSGARAAAVQPTRPRRAGRRRPLRRGRRTYPVPDPAVLGRPDRQGHPARRLRGAPRRAGDVHGPVGPARRPGRRRAVVRGAGRDRGPAAAAHVARADRRPSSCSRRPSSTATSRASARATTWSCSADDGGERAQPASPSRASAATGACAWPTSSGPRSPARSTSSPSTSSRWASGSARPPPSCSAPNAYRDYLELHGLSVQLTEALAEYWHARVRAELGFGAAAAPPTTTRPS